MASPRYVDLIFDELVDLKDDGSFHLNMEHFDYLHGTYHDQRRAFSNALFGGPPRQQEAARSRSARMDLARSIQVGHRGDRVYASRNHLARSGTDAKFLCLGRGASPSIASPTAGCCERAPFEGLWNPAGRAGGCRRRGGAPRLAPHGTSNLDRPSHPERRPTSWQGSYLGTRASPIARFSTNPRMKVGAVYQRVETGRKLPRNGRSLCWPKGKGGRMVPWTNGIRPPRAGGGPLDPGRSPAAPRMQSVMKSEDKVPRIVSGRSATVRTGRKPASEYFDLSSCASPYMLLVAAGCSRQKAPGGRVWQAKAVAGIDRLRPARVR